jgi:pilus assembly protein CpaB
MTMQRRVIGVVAAVLLAAVGTLALVGYVRGAEARSLAGEETVEVLVVKDQIDRNTPTEELADLVATERVPAKVRAANGVASLDDLDGQVAAVDLMPGEQLVTTRFATPAQLAEQSGVDVPDGLQEVTVSLEPQRAVGGQIGPGDLVGLLASFVWDDDPKNTTKMNHQQVLVTNVQVEQLPATPADGETEENTPDVAPTGNLLVTLAVDVEQAERIVFVAEHGTLWLTAQDEDTDQGGSTVREPGNIYGD